MRLTLETVGARSIWTEDDTAHLLGGCRMGFAPGDSVTNADGRTLGHSEPVGLRRIPVPDRRRREPVADDHGARVSDRRSHRGDGAARRLALRELLT
jgi:hypothetical protein